MTPEQLPEIKLEPATVLRLQPGDVLVLSVEQHITRDMSDRLRARFSPLKEQLGLADVVILDGGATFSVMRPAA